MAKSSCFTTTTIVALVLFVLPKSFYCSVPKSDIDLLEFPLNLEYLEAEFFLYGSLGVGLDKVAPNLTKGGPTPIGGQLASLDPVTKDVILQFALQEVGHLRLELPSFILCFIFFQRTLIFGFNIKQGPKGPWLLNFSFFSFVPNT